MTDEAKELVERLRGDWPEILVEKHWMMDSDAIDKQREEAADLIETQAREIERLREALQWMVDNDETNEGDEPIAELGGKSWDEINAYWIDGLNRARAALAGEQP